MDEPDQLSGQEADRTSSTQHPDYQSGPNYEQQQQQLQASEHTEEEVVQVVYQRDQHGSLVGVESTSLLGSYGGQGSEVGVAELAQSQPLPLQSQQQAPQQLAYIDSSSAPPGEVPQFDGSGAQVLVVGHQQLSRAASTLPSVAEESTSSGPNGVEASGNSYLLEDGATLAHDGASFGQHDYQPTQFAQSQLEEAEQQPIYSTVNKHSNQSHEPPLYETSADYQSADLYANQGAGETYNEQLSDYKENLGDDSANYETREETNEERSLDKSLQVNQEISQIIARQKAGAVERGSFRHNFRKKLGLSVSTNENDLTAHRQKFIELVQDDREDRAPVEESAGQQVVAVPLGSQKFKRTHSVSFNVHGSRSNRHSVDIRNLPSYLTHKRASIVDVAKGAMSSLISSLGGGGGAGSGSNSIISSSHARRDSMNYDEMLEDNEPIFEEPIAPTLSLGQRVAMVRNSGTEFGTVGWIGQLPDIDDDWIVGVIFDNLIGDCDGAYKGTRYFYARDGYAMFVPLSVLTKTDNYIGRPETGTVLSRMSVSLKPGQLISIQRSSIRLQHCFLNAPHQRVGHDVRAVSNRLHCQCHNCGPCAHLTKQGRPSMLPHFGAHHLPIKKKNSLAHAAVEMLAHHHHHFHEEEEHEEKDYEFGDNAAHACNFVRYSCCQQSGQSGHEFSTDCSMVRPELLDNLLHVPKAPHRRSRPKRKRDQQHQRLKGGDRTYRRTTKQFAVAAPADWPQLPPTNTNTLETNQSTMTGTMLSASTFETGDLLTGDSDRPGGSESSYLSSGSASSSSSSSGGSSRADSPKANEPPQQPYNYYQYDTSSFRPQNNVYKTVESQVSIVDQQRFVFRRDSSAFVQSPLPSNWSDDQDSSMTTSGLGTRLLRCLGCLKRRPTGRRPRRKLSFKDKVLEFRRRQSTFVPSTLAKPHEDFASHGILMAQGGPIGRNSDYSSCSRSSSGSSSRSQSPQQRSEMIVAEIAAQNQQLYQYQQQQQQQATMELEHDVQLGTAELKSCQWTSYAVAEAEEEYRRQLNYGDFNLSESGENYKMQELSKDSALTDFAYSDTYKTNSSSDTLKLIVDHSINEQIEPLQPMHESQLLVSPLSASDLLGGAAAESQLSSSSDQVDVSSPTVSVPIEDGDQIRAYLENLTIEPTPRKDEDEQEEDGEQH